MIMKMDAPVSVVSLYDHKRRVAEPKKILFDGTEYSIVKIGFHHTYREGRTLYHVFSVSSQNLFFRLVCNSETLAWSVSEIADGESN